MTMIIPAYFAVSLQITTGNGEGRIENLAGHYFASGLLPIYFQKKYFIGVDKKLYLRIHFSILLALSNLLW